VSQRERKPYYVVVAFRYDLHNSVMYRKAMNKDEVCKYVGDVIGRYDADVISIRKVYEMNPIVV